MEVTLREVRDTDLPTFFAHMNDVDALRMAAFTSKDPSDSALFQAHWARIRQDSTVITRTILDDSDEVVGHAGVFGPPEEREVTYWIGRQYWGRGAATAALRKLIGVATERPLHARAAADNLASIQVLKKCGFEVSGGARDFANARGEEIDEVLLTLLH
ncbi:GNAT family N-acetyltransferase [Streptomyces sp. NBC_00638]|uniref:GNAT family N-acetyltransferase n=1 Tax=unclassified Streptomyces TaxID=2593676 RepID=UPI002258A0D7|nr:GNAT family N-acetyltransferase [Streptomyces sp. NBC_00638]MCX5008884.1 GNAT family N-acetyltransferase [Streptomyces sp. NBC_00638]